MHGTSSATSAQNPALAGSCLFQSADDVENGDEDEDKGWIVFNTGVKGQLGEVGKLKLETALNVYCYFGRLQLFAVHVLGCTALIVVFG